MRKHQEDKKSPFSPLQTGCAFVMLANMLLYLCVVAFVFNLLDPSGLDPSYLIKRGVNTQKKESHQDRAFKKLAEDKKKEQEETRNQSLDLSIKARNPDSSPAGQLSKLHPRNLTSNWQAKELPPTASLTKNFSSNWRGSATVAKSRQHLIPFPRAMLSKSNPSYSLLPVKLIEPEPYNTINVELAPGIAIPLFTIPDRNDTNPVEPLAPPRQAKAIQANKAEDTQPDKRSESLKDPL